MARAKACFLRGVYPETGTEDVGCEVDQLERDLRRCPRPNEAVSPNEHGKQEILLHQRPTRPEEPGQMECRIDNEQENNAAACSNRIKLCCVHLLFVEVKDTDKESVK